MRMSWAVVVAVGSLLGASSASAQQPRAQGQQRQQQGQQQQGQQGKQGQSANRAYEVTKHIAVVNAATQDGTINSQMLADISQDKRSYDRAHGELFLKNIRESITQAEGHLAHLQPLATSPKEKEQIQKLNQELTQAKSTLQPMTNQLDDPKAVHDSATKLQKQFSNMKSPLKQLAQDMDSKIKIG